MLGQEPGSLWMALDSELHLALLHAPWPCCGHGPWVSGWTEVATACPSSTLTCAGFPGLAPGYGGVLRALCGQDLGMAEAGRGWEPTRRCEKAGEAM